MRWVVHKMGLTMGLFSFLFGGKKKPKAEAPAKASEPAKATAKAAVATPVDSIPLTLPAGVIQAKLRLRMAASLRSGEHAAAYEAAQSLAEMQAKAGRKTAARVWMLQAEKIRASMAV